MIFLIIIFFCSITCSASHHDKKAMIEERKGLLLSRQIVGNAISSPRALTAWVSLQDIYNTEPTYQQLGEIRNKISTLNIPGYEVSTVILPRGGNQVRKRIVSYYKRSQNKNSSGRNETLIQALGLHLQVSDVQHISSSSAKAPADKQKKEVGISRSPTSQSLIAQAMHTQMPSKEVEKAKCTSNTNSITNDGGGLLSPIRVSRHDERCYFHELDHHSAEMEQDMQQLKENFNSSLKNRYFDSDSDDSDSDDEF